MPSPDTDFKAQQNKLNEEKKAFDDKMRALLKWEEEKRANTQTDQLRSSSNTVYRIWGEANAEFRNRGKTGNIYSEPSILEKKADEYFGLRTNGEKARLVADVKAARKQVQAAAEALNPHAGSSKETERRKVVANRITMAGFLMLAVLGIVILANPAAGFTAIALTITTLVVGGSGMILYGLYRRAKEGMGYTSLKSSMDIGLKGSDDTSLNDAGYDQKQEQTYEQGLKEQKEADAAEDAELKALGKQPKDRDMQHAREKVDAAMHKLLKCRTDAPGMHGEEVGKFALRDRKNGELYHNPTALEKHSNRFATILSRTFPRFASPDRKEEMKAVKELKKARAELASLAQTRQPGKVSKSSRDSRMEGFYTGLKVAVGLGIVAAFALTPLGPAALALAAAGAVGFAAAAGAVAGLVYAGINRAVTPSEDKIYDMGQEAREKSPAENRGEGADNEIELATQPLSPPQTKGASTTLSIPAKVTASGTNGSPASAPPQGTGLFDDLIPSTDSMWSGDSTPQPPTPERGGSSPKSSAEPRSGNSRDSLFDACRKYGEEQQSGSAASSSAQPASPSSRSSSSEGKGYPPPIQK